MRLTSDPVRSVVSSCGEAEFVLVVGLVGALGFYPAHALIPAAANSPSPTCASTPSAARRASFGRITSMYLASVSIPSASHT